MEEKSDLEIFLNNVPALDVWYKALLTYTYHFFIFILVMISFWWIGSNIWIALLPAQLLIACVSNVPLMYVTINFDKIREKYLKKYKKHPWQHFWYHYSYTSPFGCFALYSPLLLKTDYFLPSIINLPSNFITQSLFPIFVAIPLGVIFIFLGIMFVTLAQDHDRDMDFYMYFITPYESRLVTDGIYRYIRHPRVLSRLTIAVGFGFIANNLLAIGVALTHLLPYYIYIMIEDKEILRRFGEKAQTYQMNVPLLLPKYGNWKNFLRLFASRIKSK